MTFIEYFRPIKNIRLAIRKRRESKAHEEKARRTKKVKQRNKLYDRAAITRREFGDACVRATAVPGLIALTGGLSGLAYYLLARKTETKKISSSPKRIATPKDIALKILYEVKDRKTMSSRYEKFIDEIIRLIEAGELKFASARNLGPRDRDFNAIYHPENDTLELDLEDFPNFDLIEFKAILLHELFHVYQDHLKLPMPASRTEAEAHLAKVDYLYHSGQNIPETWFKFVESYPQKKSREIIPPQQFNVPISIVKKLANTSFASAEYKQAIKMIAENYLWSILLRRFQKPTLEYKLLLITINEGNLSETELRQAWEKQRRKIINNPISIYKVDIEREMPVLTFLAVGRILEQSLWNAGKKAETLIIYNETFEAFKKAVRLTDPYRIDGKINFDGVE
jgi:hypothetical protein